MIADHANRIGLDYAVNRYYSSTWGRFTSADPYQASGGAADPQSWNRYAFVEGDPANYGDPAGLQRWHVTLWGRYCGWLGAPGDSVYGCVPWWVSYFVDDGDIAGGSPGGGGANPGNPATRPSGAAFAGFDRAIDAVRQKPDCAALLSHGTPNAGEYLAQKLNQAIVTLTKDDYGLKPVSITIDANGNIDYTYITAYTTAGNIYLNGYYFPDPTLQTIKMPDGPVSFLQLVNQALGQSMNAETFGAFVFLHELGHILDNPANSNQPSIDTIEFNQRIISTCLN